MAYYHSDSGKQNVINWIIESLQLLIEKDGELSNYRLAHYLETVIPKYGYNNYQVDTECNEYMNNQRKVRSIDTGAGIEVNPDIIVHKRGSLNEPIPHLLVVEAKKDRNNVRDIMVDCKYLYKYGLLVSYDEDEKTVNCELKTFENNIFKTRKFSVAKSVGV